MRANKFKMLCLLLVCAGGCVWNSAEQSQETEHGRLMLITALDAWKSGQVRMLATRTPPIRFQDDDLHAGYKLMEYRIVDSSLPITPFKNINVELEMIDPTGKLIRRFAVYQVGLEPLVTVQRSDN